MTKKIVFLFFFSLIQALPCFAQLPAKRALVFGLGEQQDASWGKINGDKDIEYIVPLLQSAGYTDIVTLKNSQATKAAMLKAFEELAGRCGEGDAVYVHYSGHGQLMTDINGDEQFKWSGRHAQWDEAWIPYDAYMMYGPNDRGEKHLSDDEVARCLSAVRESIGPEGELVVVVDACHSGDATCGDVPPVRGIDVKFTIPMSSDAPLEKPIEEQWLTVSACKPYQLNAEMNTPKVGKLTYALYTLGLGILDKENDEMQKTLAGFMDENKGHLPQSPVVSGVKKISE
ncbi:MAG: caspase family protein [Bacteroidaceae bacterium]|nr:caspase family protein [Bacteroidaceae bacterium]